MDDPYDLFDFVHLRGRQPCQSAKEKGALAGRLALLLGQVAMQVLLDALICDVCRYNVKEKGYRCRLGNSVSREQYHVCPYPTILILYQPINHCCLLSNNDPVLVHAHSDDTYSAIAHSE